MGSPQWSEQLASWVYIQELQVVSSVDGATQLRATLAHNRAHQLFTGFSLTFDFCGKLHDFIASTVLRDKFRLLLEIIFS
jgi:hypothetical protein